MLLMLPPHLSQADSSRSAEWMNARNALDKAREKQRGKGFVIQLTRAAAREVVIHLEFRGDEACQFSCVIGDPAGKDAKPQILWNQPASFHGLLREPFKKVLPVPEDINEISFLLVAQGLGSKAWKVTLPEIGTDSKVMVLYLPDPQRANR